MRAYVVVVVAPNKEVSVSQEAYSSIEDAQWFVGSRVPEPERLTPMKFRDSEGREYLIHDLLVNPPKKRQFWGVSQKYFDSGRKLMRECILSMRLDSHTAILEYNRVEAELEKPQWFAVTRWCAEDVMAAAEEQGIPMTNAQAVEWWKRNERRFQDLMVEHWNEILSDMDFGEGE